MRDLTRMPPKGRAPQGDDCAPDCDVDFALLILEPDGDA